MVENRSLGLSGASKLLMACSAMACLSRIEDRCEIELREVDTLLERREQLN